MTTDEHLAHETAVIGCLLRYGKLAMPFASTHFTPAMFTRRNAYVFDACQRLFSAGTLVNLDSVCVQMFQDGTLEAAGGRARLLEASFSPVPPITLEMYAPMFADRLATLQVTATLESMIETMSTPGTKVGDVIAETLARMEEIANWRTPKTELTMRKLLQQSIDNIQKRATGETAGVSTGIGSLDRLTGGIAPGSQWVIAGPPKGGKSSLAITMLSSLAVKHGKRCALYGLEMPSVENIERLLCHEGRISAEHCRDGTLTDNDMNQLAQTTQRLANVPIHCRDDLFDLVEIISSARQLKSSFPDLYAIFVDYAQLVSAPTKDANREREVATVSRTLRKFSMQSGVAVILLSQTNDDGRLRESRTLGMDATKIITIEFGDDAHSRTLKLTQRDGMSGVDLKVAYRGDLFMFLDSK